MDPEAVPLGLEDDWEAQLEELGGLAGAAEAVDELRRPGYDPALADKVLAMEDKVSGPGRARPAVVFSPPACELLHLPPPLLCTYKLPSNIAWGMEVEGRRAVGLLSASVIKSRSGPACVLWAFSLAAAAGCYQACVLF